MSAIDAPLIFSLASDADYAARVCQRLRVSPGRHEEREFEDGEHKIRPLETVHGRDAYIVQSLYGDDRHGVNDRLCQVLFLAGALRDAGARTLTVVAPYLCYARKDRRTKNRDPVTTRYVAALVEAVGVDRVITVDVHNLAAYQNAFRCPTEHLSAAPLFVAHLRASLGERAPVIASPDVGGIKRVDLFRRAMAEATGNEPDTAFIDKRRSAGVVSGGTVVGPVRGRGVVLLDDLISSGTTLARAARSLREAGAERVTALATHGVFGSGANEALAEPALAAIAVTDTLPPFRITAPEVRAKLTLLDSAGLVADAMARLRAGEDPAPLSEA